MEINDREIRFQSTLAPLMEQFIEEKHACGYRYHSSARLLASFDRFLIGETLPPGELLRPIIGKWLAKKPHESALTHQHRISIVRQFALFMCRIGYHTYVPDRSLAAKNHAKFSPRILTQDEVEKILQAVDHLPLTARSPLRHLIMPEVFRLLYGCGFRLNEVLQLRVRDVDLNHVILTVRHGKFGKDRLVPPAVPLVLCLQKYAAAFGVRPPEAIFFPSPQGHRYLHKSILKK
jgi:site-specific recombinase XerD